MNLNGYAELGALCWSLSRCKDDPKPLIDYIGDRLEIVDFPGLANRFHSVRVFTEQGVAGAISVIHCDRAMHSSIRDARNYLCSVLAAELESALSAGIDAQI